MIDGSSGGGGGGGDRWTITLSETRAKANRLFEWSFKWCPLQERLCDSIHKEILQHTK